MKKIFFLIVLFLNFLQFTCFAQLITQKSVSSNNHPPYSMVFSEDNKFVYVATPSEIQTYLRNDSTGELVYNSSIRNMPNSSSPIYYAYSLQINPASNYLYAASFWEMGVFKRNTSTGELTPIQTVKVDETPSSNITTNCITLSHDHKFLYSTFRQDLYIYTIDQATGLIALADTMKDLNHISYMSFDVSCELSRDDKFLYITGGHGISVYERNLITGYLEFKQIILGSNFENLGLTYAGESLISSNNKFLYTVTNSMGAGAINVLLRDTTTGLLTMQQTIGFDALVNPSSVTVSPNNKALCVNSGNRMALFTIDSSQGKLTLVKTFTNPTFFDYSFGGRKYFDFKNRFLYTCPAFNDSILSYQLDVILENENTFCVGDTLSLSPFGEYKSFKWSNGSENPTLNITEEGKYKLEVTDSFNFKFADSVMVKWPHISLGNDTSLYKNQSLFLSPGFDYKNYEWSEPDNENPYFFLQNDSTFRNDTIISISVTAEDQNGCSNTATIKVHLFSTLSKIKDFDYQHIKVYPNPVEDYIRIECLENEKVRICIYSLSGIPVLQKMLQSDHMIDVSTLPKGVYLISLGFSDGLIVKNFIKN